MGYCSLDDVKAILDNTSGAMRNFETNLETQIAFAQAEVDARLEAAGVDTPLGTPPSYVRLATAALVAYYLVRRANTQGQFDVLMQEYRLQYDRMIKDFVAGQAEVPGEAMPRGDTVLPAVFNPHAT